MNKQTTKQIETLIAKLDRELDAVTDQHEANSNAIMALNAENDQLARKAHVLNYAIRDLELLLPATPVTELPDLSIDVIEYR